MVDKTYVYHRTRRAFRVHSREAAQCLRTCDEGPVRRASGGGRVPFAVVDVRVTRSTGRCWALRARRLRCRDTAFAATNVVQV